MKLIDFSNFKKFLEHKENLAPTLKKISGEDLIPEKTKEYIIRNRELDSEVKPEEIISLFKNQEEGEGYRELIQKNLDVTNNLKNKIDMPNSRILEGYDFKVFTDAVKSDKLDMFGSLECRRTVLQEIQNTFDYEHFMLIDELHKLSSFDEMATFLSFMPVLGAAVSTSVAVYYVTVLNFSLQKGAFKGFLNILKKSIINKSSSYQLFKAVYYPQPQLFIYNHKVVICSSIVAAAALAIVV